MNLSFTNQVLTIIDGYMQVYGGKHSYMVE